MDIELAISMAPGLSQVIVYEAPNDAAYGNDLLNRIATDNLAKQLSCSWGLGINASTEQIFRQFAAQGQSFFFASGDSGAFSGAIEWGSDDPYITVVGGTILSTSTAGGPWSSETAWAGSSGGISTTYPIPSWQVGISMAANQGSTTRRNVPDVAMAATEIFVFCAGQHWNAWGTSASAPLWAGFTALVNQQAAANGQPPVGFLNPALYTIAKSNDYGLAFHDITSGSNTNASSPSRFFAAAGYDLCTGLGSPNGPNLINALTAYAGPVWVDFSASPPGFGTYEWPFSTLTMGALGVQANGTVIIKGPGSSPETPRIGKPMIIRAVGGRAIIGQ